MFIKDHVLIAFIYMYWLTTIFWTFQHNAFFKKHGALTFKKLFIYVDFYLTSLDC